MKLTKTKIPKSYSTAQMAIQYLRPIIQQRYFKFLKRATKIIMEENKHFFDDYAKDYIFEVTNLEYRLIHKDVYKDIKNNSSL
jgi:hypothetical protein